MSLLSKGESYGYAIIQEVKARSDGKLQWADGMLYPVLHRMEHRGLIKSRWGESETGRKRKYYSLKKDGKAAMAKHHEQWSLVQSVLAGLRKEQYVYFPPPTSNNPSWMVTADADCRHQNARAAGGTGNSFA